MFEMKGEEGLFKRPGLPEKRGGKGKGSGWQ
jgi:hypothetical protein